MRRPPASAQVTLHRHLGLGSAIALVVGEVIGVGIFLTPADMARTLGSPFWILVVWVVMGLIATCGALCYAELGARVPEAGGGYVYLRDAWGPATAFMYGWKCLIVLDPGLTAALAVGMASYATAATGLPRSTETGIAIAGIVILAAVNLRGVRFGAGFLRAVTLLKLALLGALILLAFARGLGDWGHFVPLVAQRPGSSPLPEALAGGLVAAFFSFGGWWDTSKLAGEMRDPARVLPRALTIGVLAVTLIYILTSTAFLYLVPLESVTSGEAFAAQAGTVLFGANGGRIFAAIVVISVLSSMASFMMAAPRVYFAMARDGVFPRSVAEVHTRLGTPFRAIVIQAALAIVLVAIGTFEQIIAYFLFATVAFIGLTVGALFVMRRDADGPGTYRAFGYPVTPVVFLVFLTALLFLLAARSPLQAGLGTVVVLVGWPIHRFISRTDTQQESANR